MGKCYAGGLRLYRTQVVPTPKGRGPSSGSPFDVEFQTIPGSFNRVLPPPQRSRTIMWRLCTIDLFIFSSQRSGCGCLGLWVAQVQITKICRPLGPPGGSSSSLLEGSMSPTALAGRATTREWPPLALGSRVQIVRTCPTAFFPPLGTLSGAKMGRS